MRFTKSQYTFSGSKIDQSFSYSKLNAHFNRIQRAEAPTYSQQSKANLRTADGNYKAAFSKCFPSASSGDGEIDLSPFGGGTLPLPKNDLGIGISAAQMQRQPGESPEEHIARITALINSVTAAMIAHAEEQKRKLQQNKKPQIKR